MKRPAAEYACLLAPALPLQALVRSEPDLAGRAVATVEGEGTHATLAHVCRAAWDAGLRPGMNPSQARSIAPDAVLRPVPACLADAAAQALLDVALAKSPRVQTLRPGAVALDLAGTTRLYPSRSALGCAMQASAATAGLRVRVAVASGPRIALIAARACPDVTIVPAGSEAAFLAPLPLSTLDPSPELAGTLARLGLRTLGDFAALERRGIGIRLGTEAFALHRLARGEDATRLEPVVPAETFEEAVALDYVLDRSEPLSFLMAAALERLVARVEARQSAPGALRLALDLEPAGVHVVSVSLPSPTGDVRSLLALIRLAMDDRPPPAPVRGFRLVASPGAVIPVQGSLFGPPMPEPSKLSGLLTRLAVLTGPDSVGSPALTDANARDTATMGAFRPGQYVKGPRSEVRGLKDGQERALPKLAFRRFRPPMEVQVETRGGSPNRIAGSLPDRTSDLRPQTSDVSGPLTRAAGPWYAEGAWWGGRPEAGALWDVEVRGRGLFRLWHDLAADRWYVDGAYD